MAAGLPQVLVERSGADGTLYLYGLDLVGEQGTAWAYHLTDGLGSVRQLVDGSGQVTLVQGVRPFGGSLWQEGSGSSGFGYTGEQVDASTGLVFLRARYYGPGSGRFLSLDPWDGNDEQPLTLSAYLYALANPINVLDPSGLCGFIGDSPEQQKQCESLRGFIANVYRANALPGRDTRGGKDLPLYWSLEDMMTLLFGLDEWLIALGGQSTFLADMGGEFDVIRIKGRSHAWESVKLGDRSLVPFFEWTMGNDGWRRPRQVIHEIAHLWSNRTGYQREFENLFWLSDVMWCTDEDPVTDYGNNSPREDFAEAATEMILRRGRIDREIHPRRFNFMLNRMKGLWDWYGPPDSVCLICD